MTEILVYYDEKNDILSIHKKFSDDEKFKGNIDIGKIILDVSNKERIRGIEIIDATEFLKEFNITRGILKNIEKADFRVVSNPNGIFIGLLIKAKNTPQEMPAKIAVPLETPKIR